jgi:uncharacterized protein YjbI with pentapeptide repeats
VNIVSPGSNHAEILCGGSDAWNAWREQNPCTIPDLTGIALPLSESRMESLSGGPVNLQSAWLQEAVLRFASLSTVNLEAADLSGTDLTHARLDQANLNAAKLTNAHSDYANFAGASLTKANLCGASLRFTTLSTADLEAADLSGADLGHARLDQANLSAANFTNACLDYADFAGANLTKANLCGASLHHVKNLTPAQIEDSIGSSSTILPPHLQGSVSWSVAKSQTEKERRDLRPRARDTDDSRVPLVTPSKLKAWRVGVLISFVLVATAFMWWHMGEAVPLDLSGAQRGSQPLAIQPNLGTNTADQESQPARALMEEKATAEIANADIRPKPSGSSTIDQTRMTEQYLASEMTTVSAKGAKLGDQAASAPEDSHGSMVDEASRGAVVFSAQSRHAVLAVIPAESPTSPHAIAPDLSREVSTHDPQFTSTTDVPGEAPAVNTLMPSAASSLSDAQTPSAVTVPLPSGTERDVQTLPLDTKTPPTLIRNPARLRGQNFEGAEAQVLIQGDVPVLLPAIAEAPPMPIRNPARQGVGGTR